MTTSKITWITPLLVLTACFVASHAFSVHVQRISRDTGGQAMDPLQSFSLTSRGESADGDTHQSLTRRESADRRARTPDEDQKAVYKRDQGDDDEIRHGVLLDAGSSSTKVKVYTYTSGTPPSFMPRLQLQTSTRVKPGLGQYATQPQGLGEYLQGAVEQAVSLVPQRLRSVTPVYVMATAGLRVLETDDAVRLLQQTQMYMQNKTINPFYFRPDHVSILSGEEEGVYAWLALNYLLGFFSTNMTSADSVGVLEMGGGSMQVAFLPDTPLLQEEFQVYVGPRRFDLYAQSYLNLGVNYLTEEVREKLLEDAQENCGCDSVDEIDSPCMLRGDVSSLGEVKVSGTGSPAECEDILTRILKPHTDDNLCTPSPCAIADRYQPDVTSMRFYGISALVYAPEFLGAIGDDQTLDIDTLRQNAWEHCDRTVQQAVEDSGANPKYTSGHCLTGLFIPLMLTDAMGFPNNTHNIKLAQNIGGEGIDWALGAMLQQLSMAFLDDLDLFSQ